MPCIVVLYQEAVLNHLFKILFSGVLFLLLSACAIEGQPKAPPDPVDPYQDFNQAVFNFNNGFYTTFAEPINTAYTTVLPGFVQTGISNAYQNIGTVPDMANDVLQWNWRYFIKDTLRLVLNTTLGFFGTIDVAGNAGIPSHEQGFSYTLAKWGYVNSSYLVLPILGPNTVSSAISLVPDYFMSPMTYVHSGNWQYGLWAVYALQENAQAMPKYQFIQETAIDPYAAMRDAYLQNRAFVIAQIKNDGVMPNSTVDSGPESGVEMSPAFAGMMSGS